MKILRMHYKEVGRVIDYMAGKMEIKIVTGNSKSVIPESTQGSE